jgi:catechol 2,3-dioxygenase-like lactoylglutathione lyase family enzyme
VSATLGGGTAVSLQSVGAITLFVDDPQRSRSFYERVFGLHAAYEYEDARRVQPADYSRGARADRSAPVAERGDGSRFQLTIWVDDADAACAALADRGVELVHGPADRGWGMRTAAFSDPDSHIWEIAEELEAQ